MRSLGETPPPNPLPEAERGSKTEPCSSPPLRFGEGVGGRGLALLPRKRESLLPVNADLARLAQFHLVAVVDRVLKVRPRRAGRAETALRVQRDERHLRRVDAAAYCHVVDLPHRRLARLLRTATGPHRLHDGQAPADANDLLANARCARGAGA